MEQNIIADFMGLKNTGPTGMYKVGVGLHTKFYTTGELKYNESWDWLMPVVAKIRQVDFTVNIKKKQVNFVNNIFNFAIKKLDEALLTVNISEVYTACYVFIYNMNRLLNEPSDFFQPDLR